MSDHDNDQALQVLQHIGNELKLLWLQMDAWQEMFDVEQEKRQALCNATAPGFFNVVRFSLAEGILMRVARLMDPPRTAGQDNASFAGLAAALPADAQADLRNAVNALHHEWASREEQGRFCRLKTLRHKWLAHADRGQRDLHSSHSIWMPLTHDDFVLAQELAGRLWSLYRQANRALRGCDVLEPGHASLADRPAMLLKHLSASLCLEDVLVDGRAEELEMRQVCESRHVGEDRVRRVFLDGEGR